MERLSLGPNGGILFCMEFVEDNMDQIKDVIMEEDAYILFDCPGQVAFRMILLNQSPPSFSYSTNHKLFSYSANHRLPFPILPITVNFGE